MTPQHTRLVWSIGLAVALVAGGGSVGLALVVAAQQRAATPTVEAPAAPSVAGVIRR